MIGEPRLPTTAAVRLCPLRLRLQAAPGACRSARHAVRSMRECDSDKRSVRQAAKGCAEARSQRVAPLATCSCASSGAVCRGPALTRPGTRAQR